MSSLVRANQTLNPTRTERLTDRALERVRAQHAITAADQIGKVDVVAATASAALLAASEISSLESLLVTRTPRAEERLRIIADAAAVNLTDIVISTRRSLR